MNAAEDGDFFDRARSVAASLLFAAGAAAIAGSLLEWVTIEPPPIAPASENFSPYTGLEARDGWFTLIAGVLLFVAALGLVLRQRASWGWLGFITSICMGAIAIADYKGVGHLESSISERMERAGAISPALGLTLVSAAAVIGLIAAVTGIAATPRRQDDASAPARK